MVEDGGDGFGEGLLLGILMVRVDDVKMLQVITR